jgi:hypothetical protein
VATYTLDWSETDLGGSAVTSYGSGAILDFTDKPSGATSALSITSHQADGVDNIMAEFSIETSGSSVMTFDYKVSTESGWDKFHIDVDGVSQANYSGTVAWTTHGAINIASAGVHTIRFRYTKDSGGAGNDDRVWVALLSITNTVTVNDASGTVDTYDMEDGAVPSFVTTSTWTNSTSEPIAGTRSLRSPASPANGGTYDLEIEKAAGSDWATVGFDFKVSTESGWDKLWLFPDATATNIPGTGSPSTSGEAGWLDWSGSTSGRLAVILPAAESSLLLRYTKDGGGAGGSDAVWIDNLDMPSAGGGGAPIEEAAPTVTETDAAQALGRRKVRAAPVDTEADAAQALGRRKRRTAPLPTEADTVVALGRVKRRALPVVTETDAAVSLGRVKRKSLPVTTEADTTVAPARRKRLSLPVATETDTAVAIGAGSITYLAVPTVTEAGAVVALARTKRQTLAAVAETDAATTLAPVKRRALPVTTEAGAILTLARMKARALAPVTELGAVVALGRRKLAAVATLLELDAVGQVRDGTVVIVTPAERTVTVPAEDRVVVVPAESRTVVVPAYPRTLEA